MESEDVTGFGTGHTFTDYHSCLQGIDRKPGTWR